MKIIFPFLMVLGLSASIIAKGLFVDLMPTLGYYTLPDTVKGLYSGGYTVFPLSEVSPYGYYYGYNSAVRYTETFPLTLAPGWGLAFQIGYRFTPLLSVGFEADWSRSLRIAKNEDVTRDSTGSDDSVYPYVPHDYALMEGRFTNRSTIVATHAGVNVAITRPLPRDKWSLNFGCGVGSAILIHDCQVTASSIHHDYYQFNGNLVASDSLTGNVGLARVEYRSIYFRPFASAEYAFDSTLSVFYGLSCALSYVYEGESGNTGDYYYYGNGQYLPDDPFLTGDIRLFAGVRLNFNSRSKPPLRTEKPATP